VHQLQGKAERVKSTDLISTLADFYREKLALRNRHVAGAAVVPGYEFNNTYQNIVAREDAQVSWLREALRELGATVPEQVDTLSVPSRGKRGDATLDIARDDSRTAEEFLARWRPRVAAMSHARHGKMLSVILGETVEHKRFFDQIGEGRLDVLGKRPDSFSTGGGVLPVRWVE
jgi:hypothetical protein